MNEPPPNGARRGDRLALTLAPALCAALMHVPVSAAAAEPSGEPEILLEGGEPYELAPHGEGNVYAPHVLREGGLHRMWYGAQGEDGHDRIAYAESADGEEWTRKGIALEDATANHINDPCVVKADGAYFMYYTRAADQIIDRMHVATSEDGLEWEPRGEALGPGEAGAWDALSVGRPAVLHEGGRFHMWYDGRRDFPPTAPVAGVPTSPDSRRSVGYATSEDGLRWTRHEANPVFGRRAGAVHVTRIGDRLVMLYESRRGTHIATSDDGVRWRDRGLLAGTSGGDLDAFGHVTPFLLPRHDRPQHWLYFGAASARTWDRNRIARLPVAREHLAEKLE